MEIIMTVLITLILMAVGYAFIGVVRLERKTSEYNYLKVELVNLEREISNKIDHLEEDIHRDYVDRINGWVASTDRRFDKAYNDIHKLDTVVNPNKDFLRNDDYKRPYKQATRQRHS